MAFHLFINVVQIDGVSLVLAVQIDGVSLVLVVLIDGVSLVHQCCTD
jgi:hypothetical protein